MDLLESEIKNKILIARGKQMCLPIEHQDGKTYVVIENSWRGVAIEVEYEGMFDEKYVEKFENIKIQTVNRFFQGKEHSLIELIANKDYDSQEFRLLCLDFLGIENRNKIIENPKNWTDRWKKLLGNKFASEDIYSYLGELIALELLLRENKKVELTNYGSVDIESKEANYEVKTTQIRSDSYFTVHSLYQFQNTINGKKLYLIFVRLEEELNGLSINTVVEKIKKLGYNTEKIEERLMNYNSETRNKGYKVLEINEYIIDEDFPKITADSFVNLSSSITNIQYTISLNGIEPNRKMQY